MMTPLVQFVMRRLKEKGYRPVRMGQDDEVETTMMIDRAGHCVDARDVAKDFQQFMKRSKP